MNFWKFQGLFNDDVILRDYSYLWSETGDISKFFSASWALNCKPFRKISETYKQKIQIRNKLRNENQ